MSALGHSRRTKPGSGFARCPLRSESGHALASLDMSAKCQKRHNALQQKTSPSPRQRGRTPRDFAERNVMKCLVGAACHSGLMLAARITLLHFSVSLTMKVSKSAEEPPNIALPRSERRACTWGSARIALISLLSLSTIAPGVLLRRPMAHHWLAS